MPVSPSQQLRITPAPADLARLYPWLDDVASPLNLPKPVLHAMHVALEEAVMNIVMHGDAPPDAAEIIVEFSAESRTAILSVTDSGRPFDVTDAPEEPRAARLEDAEPGGLGIKLLRHYCQDMSYARDAGRNRLTLKFPR